jgi:hypothetical protein
MNRLQLNMRLSADESARLDEGAARFRTTRSGFIRRSISAALAQRPLFAPAELEELARLREQLRRAGVNLNVLLRNLHLYEDGVMDRPPPHDELEAAANMLCEASKAVTEFLGRFR